GITRNVIFRAPIPGPVPPPAFGAHQQWGRRGVAPPTDPSPPPPHALDREFGRVMADAYVDEAFVPLLVIGPVRNRRADTQMREVVHVDLYRSTLRTPCFSGVFEVPDSLLFLGVD